MSKYVMSDIHGCYKEFIQMLDIINFNENDELYIIGDIFDRGPEPLKILDYVIGHKNIILLKGNHEKMFEEAFETSNFSLWYYNGGQVTHSKLIQGGLEKEQQIYDYIRRLSLTKVVGKYILVHAGMSSYNDYLELDEFLRQTEETCLWSRENIANEKKYRDYTIICGHTPVQAILNNADNPKILRRYGTIYIDCGCCFKIINGKLACLRLDDMQEFYV
jgi:serine/threonine protein phosphatase 1